MGETVFTFLPFYLFTFKCAGTRAATTHLYRRASTHLRRRLGSLAILLSQRERRTRRVQRGTHQTHIQGARHSLHHQADVTPGSLQRPEGRQVRPDHGPLGRLPRRVRTVRPEHHHAVYPECGHAEEQGHRDLQLQRPGQAQGHRQRQQPGSPPDGRLRLERERHTHQGHTRSHPHAQRQRGGPDTLEHALAEVDHSPVPDRQPEHHPREHAPRRVQVHVERRSTAGSVRQHLHRAEHRREAAGHAEQVVLPRTPGEAATTVGVVRRGSGGRADAHPADLRHRL